MGELGGESGAQKTDKFIQYLLSNKKPRSELSAVLF